MVNLEGLKFLVGVKLLHESFVVQLRKVYVGGRIFTIYWCDKALEEKQYQSPSAFFLMVN
jgi:hypothetical protein